MFIQVEFIDELCLFKNAFKNAQDYYVSIALQS